MGRLGRGVVIVVAVAALAAVVLRLPEGPEAATDDRPRPAVPKPQPSISVAADPAGTVPWDRPLEVTAANGQIWSVTAADADGQAVSGATSPDGTVWRSTGTLIPQTAYTVRATVAGAGQHPVEQTVAVTASAPATVLHATLSPRDGEVVGVGMPAVVTFDHPVAAADRPVVEQRLSVSTTPPVAGAWRWINPARVHWRPQAYWQPGTEVTVRSDLRRLHVGDAWGTDERTTRFRIGDAHISTVDVATHQMTVTKNGLRVNTFPISAGRERYPTRNGVHIALAKARTEIMDSATVGIPRSQGGYYKKVAWATRLSYSGTFVHAAPWSVTDQGQRNVSHGCINASDLDAQWFFHFTKRGDVVEVVNSTAPPKLSDPGMADWNIPWDQWDN